jgi:hypothetical protein
MRAAHAVSHLGTRGKPRCSVLYCTVTRAGPRQAQQRAVGRRERGKEDKRKSPPPLNVFFVGGPHLVPPHSSCATRGLRLWNTHTHTCKKKKKRQHSNQQGFFVFFPLFLAEPPQCLVPGLLQRFKLHQRRRRGALEAELTRAAVDSLALGAGPESQHLPGEWGRLWLGLLALVAQHIAAEIHLPTRARPVVRVLARHLGPAGTRRQWRSRRTTLEALALHSVVHLPTLAEPVTRCGLADTGAACAGTDTTCEARGSNAAKEAYWAMNTGGEFAHLCQRSNSTDDCTRCPPQHGTQLESAAVHA